MIWGGTKELKILAAGALALFFAVGCNSAPSSVNQFSGSNQMLQMKALEGFWLLSEVDGVAMSDPNDPAYLFVESLTSPLSEIGCSGAAAVEVTEDFQFFSPIPSRYVQDAVDTGLATTCFTHFLNDSHQVLVFEALRDGASFQVIDSETLIVYSNDETYVFTRDSE